MLRLKEEDLLSEEHFPISALLNLIRDHNFIRTLEWLSKGHGFGEEYGACMFPKDQDEYDIETDGVLTGVYCGLHNGQEIIADYNTFYYYLKKSCDIYVANYPNDTETVNNLLANFRELFDIPNEG